MIEKSALNVGQKLYHRKNIWTILAVATCNGGNVQNVEDAKKGGIK